MGVQYGPNAGISDGIGYTSSGTAIVPVEVITWNLRQQSQSRRRRGPSGESYRPIRKDDNLGIKGWAMSATRPVSEEWEGQEIEFLLQNDTSKTILCTAVIDRIEFGRNKEKQDEWDFELSAHVIGEPEYSEGWNEQQAATPLVKTDAEVYDNSRLTWDEEELARSAVRFVDWWDDLASDDFDGLSAKLLELIGSIVGPTGLVYRPCNISQDAEDGGTAILVFGERTTKDDIEFPQSRKRTETTNVAKDGIVVKVTDSSTPPDQATLNPDSTNLSFVWCDSHQLTSAGKWVHATAFGKFTPSESMGEAHWHNTDDPVDAMVGEAARYEFNTSATPPSTPPVSNRTCVRRTTRRVGKTTYMHLFYYDFRANQARMEADRTRTLVCTSGLANRAVTADVWLVSGGAPSTPTLANFVLRDVEDYEVPNPLYKIRVYTWGLMTRGDEIEHRGTSATRSLIASADGVTSAETQFDTCSSGTSIVTLVEAAFDARLNTAGFRQVTGFKNNPTRYTIRATFVNDDMAIFVGRARKTRMVSPIDKSGTYVNIVEAFEAGNGNYRYTMGAFEFDRLTIPFTIRRWFTGITDPTDNFFVSFLNKTNNAPFLGFATGSVMLLSASFRDNLNNTMAHAVPVDFDLAADDFFWAITKAPRVGLRSLDPTGTITAANDYSATSISAQWATETPTQADLSFIIT